MSSRMGANRHAGAGEQSKLVLVHHRFDGGRHVRDFGQTAGGMRTVRRLEILDRGKQPVDRGATLDGRSQRKLSDRG